MAFWKRNIKRISSSVGLALLALAFAYRWGGWQLVQFKATPQEAQIAAPAKIVPAPAVSSEASEKKMGPPELVAAPSRETVEEKESLVDFSEEALAEVDDALQKAESAFDQGYLLEPEKDSALYWYDAALEVDPDNVVARRGKSRVIETASEQAHAFLDEGDVKGAQRVLDVLDSFDGAEEACEEVRLRGAQYPRVRELLQQGAERAQAGRLFEPKGESAVDSYRAASALDGRNVAAKEGLRAVQGAVLSQALAEAANDFFPKADGLLGVAAAIDENAENLRVIGARIAKLKQERINGILIKLEASLDAKDVESSKALLVQMAGIGADPELIKKMQGLIDQAVLYAHLKPGETFSDNLIDREGSGPKMVVIPVGSFRMGSTPAEKGHRPNEAPAHQVTFSRPFAMARTEITVAQFSRFVSDTDYVSTSEKLGVSRVYEEKNGQIVSKRQVSWRLNYVGAEAGDNDPVVHISWIDAQAYAAWLAEKTKQPYRLPSEAEFEYVLRAGSQSSYWWGNGSPDEVIGNFTGAWDRSPTKRSWTNAFARYRDGFWGSAPVGSFPANPFGVFDLDGNVSEWVEDCWHDSYLRAPADGSAWVNPGCAQRSVRGGSWGSAIEQFRSAYRIRTQPDSRGSRLGFRVVRNL